MERLSEQEKLARFEAMLLPHLDSAYNLARWLTRNDYDAEDAVQEAYLRALRFFDGFRGGDPRAWLLKIVRNSCYTLLSENRPADTPEVFDEEIHSQEDAVPNPELLALRGADSNLVRQALEDLPAEFREVVVLRELEGLSYKEIAEAAGISMGTVMSRLSRGRRRLEEALVDRVGKER